MLHRYSEAIRGNLSKVMRLKIVALVTVEVHARDVIDKLAKTGCCDMNAFDWLCQLRLYWDKVREGVDERMGEKLNEKGGDSGPVEYNQLWFYIQYVIRLKTDLKHVQSVSSYYFIHILLFHN